MPDTPRWLKVVKVLFFFCVPATLLACYNFYLDDASEFGEMLPVSLIVVGLSHLVARAPYSRWKLWELPLALLSFALITTGAFLFTPEDREREMAFQLFLAAFAGLAFVYGFFCSSVKHNSPLRRTIIEPTKKISQFGVTGFDIGLLLAPFAFVVYAIKYWRDPGRSGEI